MLINKLKEKYPNNLFLKLLANKRFRSLIYLIFWCLFILIIYLTVLAPLEKNINNNLNNTISNEIESQEDIFDLNKAKENLLNYNFSYIYTYQDNNIKITYNGSRINNNQTGYKELNNEIIKYQIINNEYYTISNDNPILIDNEIILNDYFNLEYIFNLITNTNCEIIDNILNFQFMDIYVNMVISKENIVQIIINKDEQVFDLKFANINLITDLNY